MSQEIVDYSKNQLRDLFTRAGLSKGNVETAIKQYGRYREGELSSLLNTDFNYLRQLGPETIANEIVNLRDGKELVEEVLSHFLKYIDHKKGIDTAYQKSKSWEEVYSTSVYMDDHTTSEAFIDYLEGVTQTKVKDGKHLQELTGIGDLKDLEDTLRDSRASKYSRAMETALLEGAKYEDLLKIKAQDYGLPETDKNGKDYQYSTILDVISWEYLLIEQFAVRPDLRTISRDLEAPYSLVLDAWKLRQY